MDSVRETWDQVVAVLATYGLDVVGAIVILIVGWIGAGWASRVVVRTLSRSERVDVMLRHFFGEIVRYTILIFTVFAVLAQFGIQTASILAVLGAGALAIGLALQGTLSNVAAGVMLLLFRPFRVGDYVEAGGQGGTVKALNLFMTELWTPDNVQLLVPNGQVWGSAVKNYSRLPTRRMDLPVGISYGDDIGKAMASCQAVIDAEARILADPAPMVAVTELADSSVNLVVRFWCNAADYWSVRFDMIRKLKERLDADGITIPFPQRDVHLKQE